MLVNVIDSQITEVHWSGPCLQWTLNGAWSHVKDDILHLAHTPLQNAGTSVLSQQVFFSTRVK